MIVNGKPRFVRGQISRAKLIPRNDTLKEQSHDIKKPSRVPFTITYIKPITQPYLTSTNTAEETTHSQFNSTRTQNIHYLPGTYCGLSAFTKSPRPISSRKTQESSKHCTQPTTWLFPLRLQTRGSYRGGGLWHDSRTKKITNHGYWNFIFPNHENKYSFIPFLRYK